MKSIFYFIKTDKSGSMKEINIYTVINQASWPLTLYQDEAHERKYNVINKLHVPKNFFSCLI